MFKSVDTIRNEICYYFYKNYRESFYNLSHKKDRRKINNKNRVIGDKMNFNDFENLITNLININLTDINNDNNINNINNFINSVIDKIVNLNESYKNYEPDFLFIKIKNKLHDNCRLNYYSFINKFEKVKNKNKPFFLLLFPNYQWQDSIIIYN